MADEKEPKIDEKGNEPLDPIEQLKELKEKSVSKEEYDKVKAQYNALFSEVVEGKKSFKDETEEIVKEPTMKELQNDLFSDKDKHFTNLEYAKKALKLREKVLEKQDYDIFAGHGSKFNPSSTDKESAQRVAQAMQWCVDNCDNNPENFNYLFNQRIRK